MALSVVGDSGENHRPFPLCPEKEWIIGVSGEVEEARVFSLSDLFLLPQREILLSINCVSVGKLLGRDGKALFKGVLFADLVKEIFLKRDSRGEILARTVGFFSKAPGTCGPQEENHHTFLDLAFCLDSPHLLLAGHLNGEALPYKNGGPLRTVVGPDLFFYKSIKWLEKIRFLSAPLEECRGTWEKYAGYHNLARVEKGERFEPFFCEIMDIKRKEGGLPFPITRPVPPDQWEETFEKSYQSGDLSRLVVAQLQENFLLPRDFSGCFFSRGDYRGQFRGINFKQALFYGANLEGANFSLCKFPAAKFSDRGKNPASLKGADLEGAILMGAHLEGVSLEGANLGGARFYPDGDKKKRKAFVGGMKLTGVLGLDEKQKKWLIEDGAVW